jgi:hypothetical protein
MDNNNEKGQNKDDVRKPSLWLFVAALSALMAPMSMGCVLGNQKNMSRIYSSILIFIE